MPMNQPPMYTSNEQRGGFQQNRRGGFRGAFNNRGGRGRGIGARGGFNNTSFNSNGESQDINQGSF